MNRKKISFLIIILIYLISQFSLISKTQKNPIQSDVIPSEVEFYNKTIFTLKNKNVVLITNTSGIGKYPEKIQEIFKKNNIKLNFLIGLEHGFWGLMEDFSQTPITLEPVFGVKMVHAYKIKSEQYSQILNGVDVIIFDVQDMGMRAYTYLTVLKRMMDALINISNQRIKLLVLDHPNPALYLGARGEMMNSSLYHFAGEFPLPFYTGLTIGESALFYNEEYLNKKVNLDILPVKGFKRKMVNWEKEGIVWETPSPNLPNLNSAQNYLGFVLLEGVNLSVGRGTQSPFDYVGAPWLLNSENFMNELNQINPKDYYFHTSFFKPTIGPYKNTICRGFRVNILKQKYDPLEMVYNVILKTKSKFPQEFKFSSDSKGVFWIDLLWGNSNFRTSLEKNIPYTEFKKTYKAFNKTVNKKIIKYFIY